MTAVASCARCEAGRSEEEPDLQARPPLRELPATHRQGRRRLAAVQSGPAKARRGKRLVQRLGAEARRRLMRGAAHAALAFLADSLTTAGAAFAAPAVAGLPVTDDIGHTLHLARPAQRIVALAPGATALLFAAGAGDRVVATIEYADEPAAAKRIPRLGDLQAIDIERLLALRPDVVVVMQAITSPLMIDRVRGLGLPVYTTRFTRLRDIAPSISRLGRLAGTGVVADREAQRLAAQLAALRATYAQRTPLDVMYQVWNPPIYAIGGPHIVTDARSGAQLWSEHTCAGARTEVLARNPGAYRRRAAPRRRNGSRSGAASRIRGRRASLCVRRSAARSHGSTPPRRLPALDAHGADLKCSES